MKYIKLYESKDITKEDIMHCFADLGDMGLTFTPFKGFGSYTLNIGYVGKYKTFKYKDIEQNIMDDPNIRQDIVDSFQDLIDGGFFISFHKNYFNLEYNIPNRFNKKLYKAAPTLEILQFAIPYLSDRLNTTFDISVSFLFPHKLDVQTRRELLGMPLHFTTGGAFEFTFQDNINDLIDFLDKYDMIFICRIKFKFR